MPVSRYGAEGWPAGMRALSPEDNLLHLCLHQSNHMFNELDLRGVLDLHEVVSRWAPDWRTVLDRARSWGVLTALHLALRTARNLLGTGVPSFVIEQSRPASLRRAWLETFIDVDGLGLYRYERHPSWLVRATVGFPLMDRLADRARFARYYAGLRVRDVLATWRGR